MKMLSSETASKHDIHIEHSRACTLAPTKKNINSIVLLVIFSFNVQKRKRKKLSLGV